MLAASYPYYLAGVAQAPNKDLKVTDKFTQETATRVALADAAALQQAITAADESRQAMAETTAHQRQSILQSCATTFSQQKDELAMALCIEAGKPIKDARGEVDRLIETFVLAAQECGRAQGEVLTLDVSARAKGYRGMTRRVPIGVCGFISPFNFPLNLAAHKIAPAIAAGCPFVLKPASATPVGALLIGDALAKTDLPRGAFSILPMSRATASSLVEDDRIKLLSFTGSDEVGWQLKARAGKKRVVLELGGNAACVVDEGTDLEDATNRLITGAFYQSGQSCIGVQRIIAHESLYAELKERLVAKTKELVAGDPKDERTFVGPVISSSDAERLEAWIGEAEGAGARVLCGGQREGSVVQASLLEKVDRGSRIWNEEAFGPVACLTSFSTFDEALRIADDSRFGLQTGVFTPKLDHALKAWDQLEVGGVIINDIPSWRVDHMPYGGVKDSGFGREGIRWSIEDMSETRLMVIRQSA